jgi:hypothetical protein
MGKHHSVPNHSVDALTTLAEVFEGDNDVVVIPTSIKSPMDGEKQVRWLRTATWRYGLGIARLSGAALPVICEVGHGLFEGCKLLPANHLVLWFPRMAEDGQEGHLVAFAKQIADRLDTHWMLVKEVGSLPALWQRNLD